MWILVLCNTKILQGTQILSSWEPLRYVSGVYCSSHYPGSCCLTTQSLPQLILTWKIQKSSVASRRENSSCLIPGDMLCQCYVQHCITQNRTDKTWHFFGDQWSPYAGALRTETLSTTFASIPMHKAFMMQVSAFSEYKRDTEIP